MLRSKSMNDKNKSKTIGVEVTGKDNIFVDCGIEGFDKGLNIGETAKGNKFLRTDIKSSSSELKPTWKKHFFWKFLIPVAGSLFVAYLVYCLGWN